MSQYESRRISAIIAGVGAVVLFVVFAAEGEWVDVAIVGAAGLLMGLFWFGSGMWASKVVRDLEAEDAEFLDEPRPPTEAMLAVDAFDEAIHDARGVPLTDQVRLGRGRVDGLLDRLRSAPPPVPSEWGSLLYELDALIGRAKPIPLTDEIRLDREEVYDVLDRMRAAFANARRD